MSIFVPGSFSNFFCYHFSAFNCNLLLSYFCFSSAICFLEVVSKEILIERISYYIGLVGIQTSEEVSILLVAITVGYLFRIMIAYGELTSVYIKTLAKHFEFTWRYHLIENFMKDWEIEKDVQEKVIIYFHDSWKRQRGIRQVPDSIKFLPINLYKEVALDISWDVFKHSHLFAEEDMAFKKALSLSVKYKFFLPGDIIFKTGDKRYEMFYVNSGIIQVR